MRVYAKYFSSFPIACYAMSLHTVYIHYTSNCPSSGTLDVLCALLSELLFDVFEQLRQSGESV